MISCLRYPLRRVKLRQFTPLTPVDFVETRCTSVNPLPDLYVEICKHLSKLAIAKLNDLLSRPREDEQVDGVLNTKKKLNPITVKLQRDDIVTAQA